MQDTQTPATSPVEGATAPQNPAISFAPQPNTPDTAVLTSDSKTMALLVWVLTLFFGFLPSLIFFFVKQDDAFVLAHSKEALNLSITVLLASFVAGLLMLILIGFLLFPLIGIAYLVFCILGALAANKGETFRAPFIMRLVK